MQRKEFAPVFVVLIDANSATRWHCSPRLFQERLKNICTSAICESFAKRSTAHTRVCFLCDKLNSRYTNPPNVTFEMETHLSSPGNNKVRHVSSDASVRNCTQLKVNAFNEIKC